MTYKKAKKMAAEAAKTSFEGITYIGNCVQDGRAANGEKNDPHGYYVQKAISGRINQGRTGRYDMVTIGS